MASSSSATDLKMPRRILPPGSALARLQRQARLGPIESLNLALLVDGDDHGVSWRVHVETDDVLDLLGEFRSLERLKVRSRCGCRRLASHRRWTARSEMPTALAMARPVQCVVSPGGSEQVNASTFATTPVESGALPGLRVLSRRRLSIPSSP